MQIAASHTLGSKLPFIATDASAWKEAQTASAGTTGMNSKKAKPAKLRVDIRKLLCAQGSGTAQS